MTSEHFTCMWMCGSLCMHTNISHPGYGGQKTLLPSTNRVQRIEFSSSGSARSILTPEPSCCLQNIGTLNFQLSGSKIYAWKQWKLLDNPYYIILDSVHNIQIFYE